MGIMNERPADKLWKEMTSQEVDHFFKLLAKRADDQDELAFKTSIELAKFLFAANTGAAAGIFILWKSLPAQHWYLFSFASFCIGTTFVGIGYLTLATWSSRLADGSVQDLNAWGRNELTVAQVDANNHARFASTTKTWVLRCLKISFVFLLLGGLLAALALTKI